jgi:hypothetical protein
VFDRYIQPRELGMTDMPTAKKIKTLSALSMAVVATMGASTHAATLTLYYDNIIEFNPATSMVVQSYSYGSTGGDYSAIPTSINIAQGDILQFGVDAVLTNNVNPDAGKLTGTITVNLGKTTKTQAVQPSFLGLSSLSIVVPSSDVNASMLAPQTVGTPFNTFAGAPDYQNTALINGVNGHSVLTNRGGAAPTWGEFNTGDVSPASSTVGGVGDHFPIFSANGPTISSNIAAYVAILSQYGAASPNYANATDFFDSLSYTAIDTDVVGTLPFLVIKISPVPEPMSLCLLALGGLGLLTQRPRRQK